LHLRQLIDDRFILIVSLPRNEAELARAACTAGADAIKVHLNVHHHASGTLYGPWAQEREQIQAVLEAATVPVGVVPGADTVATDPEMAEMARLGIDFWDAFVHHAPPRLLDRSDMGCMMAVNYAFPLEHAGLVGQLGAKVIEASIVPPEEYGSKLVASDLVRYQRLARSAAPTPIVIPTQRSIQPGDIPHLWRAGARGIVIGAIVTGPDAAGVARATADFRAAIDRLAR
jgi:hypothetical protein